MKTAKMPLWLLHVVGLTMALSLLKPPAVQSQALEDPLSPEANERFRKTLEAPLAEGEMDGRDLRSREVSKYNKKNQASVIVLQINNQGKRALMFDGDNALLIIPGQNQSPLGRTQLVAPPAKVNIAGDLFYTAKALVTDGTLPSLCDYRERKQAPYGLFYGDDDRRRQIAGLRFGKRVIFPGESSQGRLYFNQPAKGEGKVTLPVLSHPSGLCLGEVNLPIAEP